MGALHNHSVFTPEKNDGEKLTASHRPHPRRSLGQPVSTFNAAKQKRAIELKIAGWSYAKIGKELGVARQRVQQIVRPSRQTAIAIRARADNRCEKCRVEIPNFSGHLHHIASQEDYNHIDNLLYLCNPCHRREHGTDSFRNLPPGPARRAASEAFAQDYLEHIGKHFCIGCGRPSASSGVCRPCLKKKAAVSRAKSLLAAWKRGDTPTSRHSLSQAIYGIRKHNLTPEDFGPRRSA